MAATADTMYMTLSPGLDALKASPLSASAESLQLGEYLDLSSTGSPRIAPAPPAQNKQQSTPPQQPQQQARSVAPQPSSSAARPATQAQPTQHTGPSRATPSSSSNSTPAATSQPSARLYDVTPPPPGSPPENIFRYYLKLELRKMGSPAHDSIIDKYVQQHYTTFLKAMDNDKANSTSNTSSSPAPSKATSSSASDRQASHATASSPASDIQHRQPSPSLSTTSPTTTRSEELTSVSPPPPPQPFKVPMTTDVGDDDNDLVLDNFTIKTEPTHHPLFSHIDPQYMQLGHGVPASDVTAQAMREEQLHEQQQRQQQQQQQSPTQQQPTLHRRSSDAMSEDDKSDVGEAEDQDELAPLVSSMRFEGAASVAGSSSDAGSRFGSEEPVGGVPTSIRDSAAANLRPSAEEYRRLSSKEKRQLRNKISARNFRERRKEYITHLEGEIADRDAIISSLRRQMSSMSVQNKQLEEEVKTLQARQLSPSDVSKILEALGQAAGVSVTNSSTSNNETHNQAHALRPSASGDFSLSAAATPGIRASSRPSTPSSPRPPFMRRSSPSLPQHNPRKDLPANGSASSKSGSFWGSGPTVAASA